MAELTTFKDLILDSANFRGMADEYHKQGELEGALINYLLSAQALRTAQKFSYKTSEEWKKLQTNKNVAKWCEDKCSELEAVLGDLLGQIRPLQEELRRRKLMYAQRGNEDDEKDILCDNIYNLVFEKPSDCITFEGIAGLDSVKRDIETAFVYPLIYPRLYPAVSKGLLFYGMPGTGKCTHPDTPIMLFNGHIKLAKDIGVGDWLMGDDSMPRVVLSTCRGRDEMFEIIPNKGDSYTVNQPHILTLKNDKKPRITFSSDGRYRVKWWTQGKLKTKSFMIKNENKEEAWEKANEFCEKKTTKPDIIDIPLNEYQKKSRQFKHHYKTFRVPVDFEPKIVDIDPYMLGYWLGSRCGTKVEEEYFRKYASHNKLQRNLVPHDYKCNSRKVRLQLLAGFIDADGHYNKNDCGYDIVQKQENLLDDIMFVARSLGFACYKRKKCNNKTDTYYRTIIHGNGLDEIPVKIARKKASTSKQTKDPLVSQFRVKPLGIGDYCGFTVTGNGRFLLGDFTVTHNTLITKASVNELQLKDSNLQVLFFAPTASDLKGKYVGETEKNIVKYFKCASKHAMECQTIGRDSGQPKLKTIAIIFFDEFEAIAGDRTKDDTGMMTNSVNTLLQMLDGISSYPNVSVIAATNFPWKLDSAILRRFTKKVMIDLPDQTAIEKIITINIEKYIKLVAKDFLDIAEPPKKEKSRKTPECKTKCDTSVKGKNPEADDTCLKTTKGKGLLEQTRYNKYISITKTEIQAVAAQLYKQLYSASDVNRVVSQALIYAGERARTHGSFIKLNDIKDKDCVDIPDGVFMSTLSVPKDNIESINDNNLKMLEIPDLREIRHKPYGQNNELSFLNVRFHTGNIAKYVADDSIKEIYVAPPNYKGKNDFHVLFEIEVRVTFEEQESVANVWIYSFYDYNETIKLEGWSKTWRQTLHYGLPYWSYKDGVPKEFDAPGIKDPRVVNNIISFTDLPKENEKGGWQLKTSKIPGDSVLFKEILDKQLLSLDKIKEQITETTELTAFNKAVSVFNESKNLSQLLVSLLKINSVSVGLAMQSFDIISEKAIFVETKEEDKKGYKIEDKARVLTFDIRQEDLINAMGEIQATSKKDELAELRKYRKDPTGYKAS